MSFCELWPCRVVLTFLLMSFLFCACTNFIWRYYDSSSTYKVVEENIFGIHCCVISSPSPLSTFKTSEVAVLEWLKSGFIGDLKGYSVLHILTFLPCFCSIIRSFHSCFCSSDMVPARERESPFSQEHLCESSE